MTSLPPLSPDLINKASPLVTLGQLQSPGAGGNGVGSLPTVLFPEEGSTPIPMEERAGEKWKSSVWRRWGASQAGGGASFVEGWDNKAFSGFPGAGFCSGGSHSARSLPRGSGTGGGYRAKTLAVLPCLQGTAFWKCPAPPTSAAVECYPGEAMDRPVVGSLGKQHWCPPTPFFLHRFSHQPCNWAKAKRLLRWGVCKPSTPAALISSARALP